MSDQPVIDASTCWAILVEFGYSHEDSQQLISGDSEENLGQLSDLILDSPYGFGMDWRGQIKEVIEPLCEVAPDLGVSLDYFPDDEDTIRLTIGCGDAPVELILKYEPNNDSMHDVVRKINKAAKGRFQIVSLAYYHFSDCYAYAVLSAERCNAVKRAADKWFGQVFVVLK